MPSFQDPLDAPTSVPLSLRTVKTALWLQLACFPVLLVLYYLDYWSAFFTGLLGFTLLLGVELAATPPQKNAHWCSLRLLGYGASY